MEAIEYLRNHGKPITYYSVGEIVGLPALNLRAYPRIVALIKEHSNFREFQKEQYLRRESDLLVQVQDAMQQMRNRGQLITMSAIARELGTHLCALQWYGRVKEFLEQEVAVSIESRNRIAQSRDREKEFMRLVEDAVQRLVDEEQKISRKTISDLIGVSIQTLTRFPQVRLLLEEKVTFYQQIYTQTKEDELLERVKDAIEALGAQGTKVTQQTIASAIGVTRTTLKQFPRVVCLLEENRRMQAQIRENKMMIKVKEAVRVLEENDCKITNGAICEQLGIDNSNLHHYPSVIVFVQNTVKEKQKHDFGSR